MDCSPPGSSVHGNFQARILDCVAISFSRGSFWPRDWTHVSCVSCSGKWILYHCATWETFTHAYYELNLHFFLKVQYQLTTGLTGRHRWTHQRLAYSDITWTMHTVAGLLQSQATGDMASCVDVILYRQWKGNEIVNWLPLVTENKNRKINEYVLHIFVCLSRTMNWVTKDSDF